MESSGKGPKQLHILIVGAGLGGIMLGVMLEHANISYQILERSSDIRPQGSAISIGPTVMRVMAQLGLIEELFRESKPIRRLRFFSKMDVELDPNQHDGEADMMFCEERYGHAIRVIPRPILYRILLSHIPPDKIHFNKRVTRTQEHDPDGNGNSDGFMSCFCEDGSEYRGSILVGADGTYSTIRQELFQRLQESGEVEIDEAAVLPPHQHCIAGITEPLDTQEFEALGEEYGEFQVLRGKDQTHSLWLMPLTNYRIAWTLFCHLPEDIVQEYKTMHEQSWHSSPHSAQEKPTKGQRPWHHLSKKIYGRAHATLDNARSVPIPYSNAGGVFGDLLDKTNPNQISKVTTDQGVYCRWYYHRTVLMGDACHKSLPYGGQGANQAILDAIFLASQLYAIDSSTKEATTAEATLPTRSDFSAAFELYYRERSSTANVATRGSNWFDHIIGGHGFGSRVLGYWFFRFLPRKLFFLVTDRFFRVRPLLPFLPSVSDTGCISPASFPLC
ncbi:hypothetical protein BGX34_000232 [Mortierella sp. NVP85]|nr:hypothetical protein BGX34_000232 [Mortierella sp. NVP85]